jgi:uncharacterized membrane protein YagU involved in acid resistance
MKVNRWLDLLDRVGWTAIQAASAAVLTFATTGLEFTWPAFLQFVGIATAIAVVKVVIAQNTGSDALGAAVPGQVLEGPTPVNPDAVK